MSLPPVHAASSAEQIETSSVDAVASEELVQLVRTMLHDVRNLAVAVRFNAIVLETSEQRENILAAASGIDEQLTLIEQKLGRICTYD